MEIQKVNRSGIFLVSRSVKAGIQEITLLPAVSVAMRCVYVLAILTIVSMLGVLFSSMFKLRILR